MDTNKDIGSQVKEALENHTVSPSDSIWQQLEGDLKKKKKKRRVFFFWLASGLGTAALLFFILFSNSLEFNSKNKDSIIEPTITDSHSNKNNLKNTDANLVETTSNKSNNNTLEYTDDPLPKTDDKFNDTNLKNTDADLVETTSNKSNKSTSKYTNNNSLNKANKFNNDYLKNEDANLTGKTTNKSNKSTSKYTNSSKKANKHNHINLKNTAVDFSEATYNKPNKSTLKHTDETSSKNINNPSNNSKLTTIIKNEKQAASEDDFTKNKNSEQKTASSINDATTKNSHSKTNSSSNINIEKETVPTESLGIIALNKRKETSNNYKESTKKQNTVSSDKNNIKSLEGSQKAIDSSLIKEEKIAENKIPEESEKVKKEEKESVNKWSIFPHASLDYYGSFNNSFTKNISINYGLYLGYIASEKITLRVGVNKLEFKYSQTKNNQESVQELSYLEIPLEAKYKIINKKINVSTLFGISNYLLDEAIVQTNQNTLSNKDFFTKTNLSFNIGLGLQAKLNKRFSINVEPIFKYHLIPFENEFSFSIFTTSVLTGIEYKF